MRATTMAASAHACDASFRQHHRTKSQLHMLKRQVNSLCTRARRNLALTLPQGGRKYQNNAQFTHFTRFKRFRLCLLFPELGATEKQTLYVERCEDKRDQLKEFIASLDSATPVFIDEAGADNCLFRPLELS